MTLFNMLSFVFCFASCSKTPITDYLLGERPYQLCKEFRSNATTFLKKSKNKFEVMLNSRVDCNKLDKNDKAMCTIFVNNWFDHILDEKIEDSCIFTKEKETKSTKIRIKSFRKPRQTGMKPLSVLDCNICEMVVGFVLEQGTGTLATPKTYEIIQNKCKEVKTIKDNCGIFTEEVVNSMVEYLASNVHPFELCTFYGSCP